MRRREFIRLLSGAAVGAPFAASAQQPKKIPHLCFLTFDPGTVTATRFKPFFDALSELGYVDGQTITIDYLSADGQGDRFPGLAAECLRRKADVIVVTTTPAAKAAKSATQTIPIVMGDRASAGPREFRIAAELGFKTAVTSRPGVLFKAHLDHLTALPRIPVNGEFQQQRYLKVLMSGAGTAFGNRFRRVNAA